MLEVGNIVTLENGLEYLLVEELLNEGIKYFYAVRMADENNITDEYTIFEAVYKDNEEYLKNVEDKTLFDGLIEEFKDIFADKILNLDAKEVDEQIEE